MTLPYSGAPVSQVFRERWMTSNQIGDIRPTGSVQIRRGRLVRHFHPYDSFGFPIFGDYPGAMSTGFWYPDWLPATPWMDLDAVLNIKLEQSFDNNGVTSCSIALDNKILVPTVGAASILYHLVEQGYYSPLRGYVAPSRPDPGVPKTPFFNQLPNAQIRIFQGYGADEMPCTFLGLIDDIESDSIPNQMILTARDFGGVLVDEKFFGWAKEKVLRSPVTFATRAQAENDTQVGGGASASTTREGYSPDAVTDDSNTTGWESALQDTPADTQWVQIQLPIGKYSQILLRVPEGMHAYIGLKPSNSDAQSLVDGVPLTPNVFWNPNGDTVPGASGGWAYFREIPSTKGGSSQYISLGAVFYLGTGSVIRLGFRNLASVAGKYAAVCYKLRGIHRRFTQAAVAGKWVIIDDLSDIVRCCLRWAGFKYWEVENTGTNFAENAGPLVVDTSKSFMDIINKVKDYAGFTFFIAEPLNTDDDQDLGRPIFRNNRVMEPKTGPTEFIDDSLLLTDAKVKISNADDHCIIRCRGIAKSGGVGIDGDQVKRIMFAYVPPWASEQAGAQGGVLKPVTVTNHYFTTIDDCQYGCYLVGLQIALLKYTAIITLPANPGIGLDTLQSVIDRTQGLNSRLYISNRTQEMSFGSNGFWTMELGGSLADTPDMTGLLADFKAALKTIDRSGRNPWLRKRYYGYQG